MIDAKTALKGLVAGTEDLRQNAQAFERWIATYEPEPWMKPLVEHIRTAYDDALVGLARLEPAVRATLPREGE